MKLTPLDIQQQQFRTATLGGFDKKEVDAFLDLLANDVEELIRQNKALTEELKRKEAEIQEHRERERTLKETMITATRIGSVKPDPSPGTGLHHGSLGSGWLITSKASRRSFTCRAIGPLIDATCS